MKRVHEDDEFTQQSKSQRLESSGESVHTMKIIDLNDDCLMTIFGYLDLSSLFNVAISNEWLRPAAGYVYQRKFGMTTVNIGGCDDYRRNTRSKDRDNHFTKHNTLNVGYAGIDVYGLKTCLQYLHYFGPFIRNLTICHTVPIVWFICHCLGCQTLSSSNFKRFSPMFKTLQFHSVKMESNCCHR